MAWRSCKATKARRATRVPKKYEKPAHLTLKHDTEWGEWQVRWYNGNKLDEGKTSHQATKKDALDTMAVMEAQVADHNRKYGHAMTSTAGTRRGRRGPLIPSRPAGTPRCNDLMNEYQRTYKDYPGNYPFGEFAKAKKLTQAERDWFDYEFNSMAN